MFTHKLQFLVVSTFLTKNVQNVQNLFWFKFILFSVCAECTESFLIQVYIIQCLCSPGRTCTWTSSTGWTAKGRSISRWSTATSRPRRAPGRPDTSPPRSTAASWSSGNSPATSGTVRSTRWPCDQIKLSGRRCNVQRAIVQSTVHMSCSIAWSKLLFIKASFELNKQYWWWTIPNHWDYIYFEIF